MKGGIERKKGPSGPGRPLAQCVIESICDLNLPAAQLSFDYTNHRPTISSIVGLVGKSGWPSLNKLTIDSAESEDHLILSAVSDNGNPVSQEQIERLFSLAASVDEITPDQDAQIDDLLLQKYEARKAEVLDVISSRNATFFGEEMTKLDAWADDIKEAIEQSIKELDKEIRQVREV